MKKWIRRITSLLLSVLLVLVLAPLRTQAVLSGVYFTAVNEQLLDLTYDTMPFWSGSTLYVSSRMFEQGDLDVRYVKNSSMGLAVLYTNKMDLRFDLEDMKAYGKNGTTYELPAIEKRGVMFFPLNLVCTYFGLNVAYLETDTVPLIRISTDSAALDDRGFLDAAANMMNSRYSAYETWWRAQQPEPDDTWPPVHAEEGQKVFLVMESTSAQATLAAMELLDTQQATFLLTAQQMADGDLLRALVCGGHAVALRILGTDEAEIEAEIQLARELMWRNTCSWLYLIWYDGQADVATLAEDMGCLRITPQVDNAPVGLSSFALIRGLLTEIGKHRTDLTVYLGTDGGNLDGMSELLEGLKSAQFRICAWRAAD